MALTNLLPRTINTTGASLTGSSGDSNRTYTLPDSGIISSGIDIIVNGTTLHEGIGNDFTISSSIITFLNAIWDDSIIRINYFITFGAPVASSLATSTSLRYATPLMFGEAIGIISQIPSWAKETTPVNENVGTGDNSVTTFYLDQKPVVSDSYTIYYGATSPTAIVMDEVTHYELDNDSGTLVLTAAGVTLVGTSKIWASYSYYNNGMKDSFIISTLSRAEKEVDNSTNTTFTDGEQTNPAYPVRTEIQPTEGRYNDRIFLEKKPLVDITSVLDGAITDSDITISLSSSQGGEQFPTSGYIIINSEIISYTGVDTDDLTGCSRGVLGSTAASHSNGDDVHSTIVLISNTQEGTEANFTVQPWGSSVYVNKNGLMYRFGGADPTVLSKNGVAERIKVIYYYGNSNLPEDITRLTIIYAKRMLIQDNVGKSMIAGRNEFRPEMFNIDRSEIERIINAHIILPMGNT